MGFREESEEVLKKGEAQKEVHENIYSVRSTLMQSLNFEDDKILKIKQRAENKFLFLLSFANALQLIMRSQSIQIIIGAC